MFERLVSVLHCLPIRATHRLQAASLEGSKGGGVGDMIPFHTKLLTKFTCQVYLKQQIKSKIHESCFLSCYFHASRSNFCSYHASPINPLLPFLLFLIPHSHQSLNMFKCCLVKHGLKLFSSWKLLTDVYGLQI